MDLALATTPLTALLAGMVTSIHCAGMCGPLTCAMFCRRDAAAKPPFLPFGIYHAGRTLAYALLGGILATFGASAAHWISASPARILPWAFAVLFFAFALGLEKHIPQPRFATALLARAPFLRAGGAGSAVALGLATPLFPCGPLYALLGVSLFAGGFANGALLMTAFALGTIPFYFLLQSQYVRFHNRLNPTVLQRVQRGTALVAALLLSARALAGRGTGFAAIDCFLCLPGN